MRKLVLWMLGLASVVVGIIDLIGGAIYIVCVHRALSVDHRDPLLKGSPAASS